MLAGCANYKQPVVTPEPLSPAERNFETVWQGSLDVLEKYGFSSDPLRGGVQDRRAGLISSAPMVGRNWFECWRKDAATPYDLAESSLQTIHRQAIVRIKPSSPGSGQFVAMVQVNTSRSNRPYRWEPHSLKTIYGLFSLPGQRVGESRLLVDEPPEDPDAVTVPLGQDLELQSLIAADIAARTGQQNVSAR